MQPPPPGLLVMLAFLPAVWTNDIYDCPREVLVHQASQVNTEEMMRNILQCLEYKLNQRKARQNFPPEDQNHVGLRPYTSSILKSYESSNSTYDLSTEDPTDTTFQSSAAAVSQTGSSSSTSYPKLSQKNLDESHSRYSPLHFSLLPPFTSDDTQNFDYTMSDGDVEKPESINTSNQSPSTLSYEQTNPLPTSPLDEIYETTTPSYFLTEPLVTSISLEEINETNNTSNNLSEPTMNSVLQDFSLTPTTDQPSTTDFELITDQPDFGKNNRNKRILSELPMTYSTIISTPSNASNQPSTTDYEPPTPTYQTNPVVNEVDKHPPHIHAIDAQCAKDMMTINLEFNKVYNGIIYSKGFYSNPNCRYVQANSNQLKYTFTLSLNSCGTEFINGFDTQGQSYLENVLVLQNEVGFQEVWDSIRSVRCLWEGNLNKQLSVALSVGMLNQEIVTFSGDTAMASLDIQIGRGPFAQPANGLVKIGETMTLVISITGDQAFDIQVKDCVAKDADSENVVMLTDDNGCILKPKIFGSFQKTRETRNSGASILAYAYFTAFKFPDAMDLIMECNVELCKTNCDMCSEPDQKVEPRRRRRDTFAGYDTLVDPVTVGKGLKVVVPEDILLSEPLGICLSYVGFVWSAAFILLALFISCITAAFMWFKLQKRSYCKNHV